MSYQGYNSNPNYNAGGGQYGGGDSQMRAEWEQPGLEMRPDRPPCPHDQRGCGCGQPQHSYPSYQANTNQFSAAPGYNQPESTYGQPSFQPSFQSSYQQQQQPAYGNYPPSSYNPPTNQMYQETVVPCSWHKGGHSLQNPCRGPNSPN